MSRLRTATLVAVLAFGTANAQAEQGSLPDFLAGTGAQSMSIEDMEGIRGERIPPWLIALAVRQVGNTIGGTVGTRLANFLDGRTKTPTYREYQAAFGSRTALVLSVLPAALRPQIAR